MGDLLVSFAPVYREPPILYGKHVDLISRLDIGNGDRWRFKKYTLAEQVTLLYE